VLAPTTPVSPFPWTELYAREIDGQAMRNYYHWLALTYVVTLATNPALSLPCGRDEHGMPFGLQVIGRLRHDAELLQIAQALEQALAGDAQTARPLPDFTALEQARPELRSIVTHPPLTDGSGGMAARAAV
jgi:amidase